MGTRSKFTEVQLIAFYHALATTAIADLAKRENISARSLILRWRNLQRRGRLPFDDKIEAAIEAEFEVKPEPYRHSIAGPPPDSDVDGRAKVSGLSGDEDLLLEELFEVHHNWPGKPDYTPALDLSADKYRESPRNRLLKK